MASEQDHLIQARHNQALAESLANEIQYKDWIITTAFYAAVHYVEGNFAKRYSLHGEFEGGTSPHTWRIDTLKQKGYSFPCRSAYRKLYVASRQVRYLEHSDPKGAHFANETVLEFLTVDLAAIRKELQY